MNVEELAKVISEAQKPSIRQSPVNYRSASCVDIFSKEGSALHQFLAKPEFEFSHDSLFKVGSAMTLVEPNMLVNWVVLRADTVGAPHVAEELAAYLEADSNAGWEVLAIKGIGVPDNLLLEEGLWLVPYVELPECREKSALCPDGYQLAKLDEIGLTPHPAFSGFAMINSPSCALLRERKFAPKYVPREQALQHEYSPNELDQKLRDVCALMVFVSDNGPIPFAGWSMLKPSTPLSGLVGSSLSYQVDIREPMGRDEWCEEQLNEFKTILNQFYGLEPNERNKVQLSAFRISQACNAHHEVDKAIDLGVALESLLLPVSEHQLALQFSLLGAWLTEPSDDTSRRRNYKILKIVYSMRSKAVHNGQIPKKNHPIQDGESLSVTEVLDEGLRLAKECVKEYIRIGGLSDTQRESVLLGGDT